MQMEEQVKMQLQLQMQMQMQWQRWTAVLRPRGWRFSSNCKLSLKPRARFVAPRCALRRSTLQLSLN
jgi:hypothetical protein